MLKRWWASWAELKDLPPEMWNLALANLVNRLGTMALPFLTLYLTEDRGLAVTQAGAVLALYGAVALCVGPIAGRLSDQFGAVRVMETTLFGSGLSVLCFAWVQSLPALLAVTCLFAATTEAFRPANAAVIGEIVPVAQRKSAFALHRLALNLGMSIGPAIGGWVASYSYKPIFVINGIALLFGTAILRFSSFHRLTQKRPPVVAIDGRGTWWARLLGSAGGDRRFLFFLLAVLPVLMVFFQHESTLPLFMKGSLGLSSAYFGMVMTINTLIIIATEIPLNSMTSHWPHSRSMSVGAAFFALGFGGLALAHGALGVGITVAVWTIGEMILFPAMFAYVADIAPAAKQGEYMGLIGMAFSLAFMLGPIAGTQLFQWRGANSVWLMSLGTGLLSALLLTRVCSKRQA